MLTPFHRVSAFYAVLFMGSSAQTAFWPLWLQARGLSEAAVGTLIATSFLARPLFTLGTPMIADRFDAPRRTLSFALLGVAAAIMAQGLLSGGAMMVAYVVAAAMLAGVYPLCESLAHAAARREGFLYGVARSFGSAAFILANLVCGFMMEAWGPWAPYFWSLALLGLASAAAVTAFPKPPPAPERPKGFLKEAFALLRRPPFPLFALGAALVQASHAIYYAYGSIHWREIGYGEGVIGTLWALGVMGEILFFLLIDRYSPRSSPAALLALAGAGAALRWGITATNPHLALLGPLQLLHGFSFGAAHIAAMRFIAGHAPARMAGTLQGFYSALFIASCMGAASFGAAWLYPRFGAASYLASMAMGIGGLILAGMLWMRERRTG
ncbi:MFS transporter [Neomegalonema sp.]|uniref:MFS transporter n=1 Tax=Neomegalonema sp. TaxID=2039713 RepID=UPI0026306A07|nr:MFS transporter [Neomegalonema sp.]MDD2869159.1 MFS transporter [Neomegalonema sp.]